MNVRCSEIPLSQTDNRNTQGQTHKAIALLLRWKTRANGTETASYPQTVKNLMRHIF